MTSPQPSSSRPTLIIAAPVVVIVLAVGAFLFSQNMANTVTQKGGLTYGQRVESTIENSSRADDLWSFETTADASVHISITGDFDTSLTLLNAAGEVLAESGEKDNRHDASLCRQVISDAGTYTVRVRGLNASDTGRSYTLWLEEAIPGIVTRVLVPGEVVNEMMSCTGTYWRFEGREGQRVRITFSSKEAQYEPWLYLYREDAAVAIGEPVGADRAQGRPAVIDATLPLTMTYTVWATFTGAVAPYTLVLETNP